MSKGQLSSRILPVTGKTSGERFQTMEIFKHSAWLSCWLVLAFARLGLPAASAAPSSNLPPGVRVVDSVLTNGQLAITWVARGGGQTNVLMGSATAGEGPGVGVVTAVVGGGTAPWFDVCVTSVVPAVSSSRFFSVLGRLPGDGLVAPGLTSPAGHALNFFPLSWSAPTGGVLFQLQVSSNQSFASSVRESWPLGLDESVGLGENADYFSRVRAWSYYPESGGAAGPWSATRSNRVFTSTAPTVTNLPVTVTNPALNVKWSAIPLASMYQFQFSPSSSFAFNVAEAWPLGTEQESFLGEDAPFFFRVRAWSAAPETGGVATAWSAVTSCVAVVQLPAPVITNIALFGTNEVNVFWTVVPGTRIYEIQKAATNSFVPYVAYWPSNSFEFGIPLSAGLTNFFRVRAWSSLPETGGVAGHWSATTNKP